MTEPAEIQRLPAAWVGLDEAPAQVVNTFLLQLDADATQVFLSAGLVMAPPVLGTPEEQQDQLKRYTFVPINPVARLAMSRARFEELRALMNQVAASWSQPDDTGRGSAG